MTRLYILVSPFITVAVLQGTYYVYLFFEWRRESRLRTNPKVVNVQEARQTAGPARSADSASTTPKKI